MSEEHQYILYPSDNKTKTTYSNYCIFKCLAILYGITVSSICSLYIVLIYRDIHDIYISVNNTSFYMNSTNIQIIREQMEFISYCVSEKYCKRIH
jgi:hypothetical protein